MAIVKKVIGRIPQNFGEWYPKEGGWGAKNRVNLFGSEFESEVEGNVIPPATLNESTNTITVNEGWRIISDATEAYLAGDKLSFFNEADDSEYINVETDADNRVLGGRKVDGTKFENLNAEFEQGVKVQKDIKVNGSANINGVNLNIVDDIEERTEIKTDAENNILSYRDKSGKLHEESGIVTNHLGLSDKGMSEFQQALKDAGFQPGGAGDFTDAKELHVDIPHCAIVNFTGIADIPQAKLVDLQGIMEFYDLAGNYFKKEVIMNAQGRSSMGYPKKNIAIDICNNNGWDDDDTFSLTFGDWVPQDSFHLKAFYTDAFRCICPITYKIYDEISRSRGAHMDYVWKRALIDLSAITSTSVGTTDKDEVALQYTNGARCFPMGFPCIVYLNGVFYGIYSWQLKKHRDNYHMSKKKPNHVHLDGIISDATILNANGDASKIIWTDVNPEGFEIRNPKNLVYYGNDTYNENTTYSYGAYMVYGRHIYKSKKADNIGNLPTDTEWWNDEGALGWKYDADVPGCFEIAGNQDGSTTYPSWASGTYNIGIIVSHTIDGKKHLFINTVDGNTKEPAIVYDEAGDKWYNKDDDPDFKNKSKCGWINVTNTVKVKQNIINLSKVLSIISAASIVSTSNGDIAIGKFEVAYDAEKNFGKGSYVLDDSKYYMSLHSVNTGNPLDDTNYWQDITTELATLKETFETYFDVDNLIDYLIVGDSFNNWDGFGGNWQWVTYDGVKWYICIYDVDNVMGGWSMPQERIPAPLTGHITTNYQFRYIINNYRIELEARYKELRDRKILDTEHIMSLVEDWFNRVGNLKTFEKEWGKWPGFVKNDSILRLYVWLNDSFRNMDVLYNY